MHTRAHTRMHAHSFFIPLGEPLWIFLKTVFVLIGPLPLDAASWSVNISEELPPVENRCFDGRGQEGHS